MDKCPVCGATDCSTPKMCSVCHHVHDHMGCQKCGCKICPSCMHMHGEHEGHEEKH